MATSIATIGIVNIAAGRLLTSAALRQGDEAQKVTLTLLENTHVKAMTKQETYDGLRDHYDELVITRVQIGDGMLIRLKQRHEILQYKRESLLLKDAIISCAKHARSRLVSRRMRNTTLPVSSERSASEITLSLSSGSVTGEDAAGTPFDDNTSVADHLASLVSLDSAGFVDPFQERVIATEDMHLSDEEVDSIFMEPEAGAGPYNGEEQPTGMEHERIASMLVPNPFAESGAVENEINLQLPHDSTEGDTIQITTIEGAPRADA
ncbi:uncharacterized protein C8Q71DRAFT_748239 [Rhodofomes roseus]|uniref:Uncharacterized protein n=1 Tax=Rhodofomes roseus TaxID=34475 RepID=A0ABQ8KLH5_9APHY|nr:uncharacterized protein C8Q71DRAFT_748239 [Rhodofomes roseus]KAH9839163.1 hypothetical protein C8Q71DRAFT_748239 [Rhodofomes roseus]